MAPGEITSLNRPQEVGTGKPDRFESIIEMRSVETTQSIDLDCQDTVFRALEPYPFHMENEGDDWIARRENAAIKGAS